jgi:hypothetical protein
MNFNGARAYIKLASNMLVAASLGEELEDLAFSN